MPIKLNKNKKGISLTFKDVILLIALMILTGIITAGILKIIGMFK
jgi:hypothetical protein